MVNIVGFRRGYNYLNELLGLAKPFGTVVKHLVLDLRPEVHGYAQGSSSVVVAVDVFNISAAIEIYCQKDKSPFHVKVSISVSSCPGLPPVCHGRRSQRDGQVLQQ